MTAAGAQQLVALQRTLYASRNPTRRWLHCSRRDWLIAKLAELGSHPAGAALEVGPGAGVYLPTLARLYGRVVAADVEPAYLAALTPLCAAHRNLVTVQDDITATQLPAAAFDLVLCTEVLEHIADSPAALAGIRRVLKPGGVLVATTPQRYSLLELTCKVAFLPGVIALVRAVYREPVLETGHINLMTSREFERQLTRAGFAIVARYKSGLYLPGIAELGGEAALRLARALEARVRRGRLAGLLWTQYCVARRDD